MPPKRSTIRAQPAIEYIITYSWVLVVIAIVLGALFAYGVFNQSFLTPKAPPGGCYVNRPYGPYTTSLISLEGVCNGEIPRYVSSFSTSEFSEILLPATSINGYSQITETAWFDPEPLPNIGEFDDAVAARGECPDGVELEYFQPDYIRVEWTLTSTDAGNPCTDNYLQPPQGTYPPNTWYFIAFTFNGFTGTLYIDGQSIDSKTPTSTPDTIWGGQGLGIGGGYSGAYFSGSIANVQLYNTSLPANYIQTLYQEGIAGAPVDLQGIVGWWPLNGNPTDYSGDEANAIPINVILSSNLYNYTAPG